MQEPACWLAAANQALTKKPDAHALAALDAEVIACQRHAIRIAPPLHRDAFWPFGMRNDIAHASPGELHRWPVGHLGHRLHRLRPREQADWAGGSERVLLIVRLSARKRGPNPYPTLPRKWGREREGAACAGMSGETAATSCPHRHHGELWNVC